MAVKRASLLIVIALLIPIKLQASNSVILFGGGPEVNGSEVSIELNTQWINGILERRAPKRIKHLFFTDGNAPGVDVRLLNTTETNHSMMEPLARVFGAEDQDRYRYYSSKIDDQVAPADAVTLAQAFKNIFTTAQRGDDIFVIYQGHGGRDKSDFRGNFFRLWGNSEINVGELEGIMSVAAPDVTIRYVFPQCFSGAFAKLIYKNAHINAGLTDNVRCGFLSQREDLISEGCTDSVNTKHYEDYSSYFFSAIDGKTIANQPLLSDPDWDKDGSVSFREAHFYALIHAYSIDFAHATSEDYLENWQPWYLRWAPGFFTPDNIYSKISHLIAKRYGMDDQGKRMSDVTHQLDVLDKTLRDKVRTQQVLEEKIEEQQTAMTKILKIKWPAIVFPYTTQFRTLLIEELSQIQQDIIAHEQYADLVATQDRLKALKAAITNVKRDQVQMKKILRMRKLARLLQGFNQYANKNARRDYERLIRCESAGF